MKCRAALLVLLMLLMVIPATPALAQGTEETRNPGTVEVILYAHLSANSASLSTEPGTAFIRPRITSLEFPSVELTRDLRVVGGDLYGGGRGFKAKLDVQAGVTAAAVTLEVLDETMVIARSQNTTIARGAHAADWEIPFSPAKESFTFLRQHTISLRVLSDVYVYVQTDATSFLSVKCMDHLSIDVETRNSEDKRATEFYPNDLAEGRVVVIAGAIRNPFGGDDVGGVNVSIKRPDGTSALDTTAAETTDLNYTYSWNYATGLPAGRYTINVTGRDMQGHEFSTVATFYMSEYGLRISTEGEEAGRVTKSTTPGTSARYTFTILNIGGRRTSVQMDAGTPIAQWTASFTRPTFDLDAGQDDDTTFEVKPSQALGGGNESKYIVTATAASDTDTPKATDTIEVETFVRNEVAFSILPEKPSPKTVGVSGTVDHSFTLRNTGEYTTSVDLTITGVPTGWTAQLVGSRVSNSAIVDLTSMEIVDIALRVGAPSSSTVKKVEMKVRCTSREYPTVYVEATFTTNLVIGVALRPTSPLSYDMDPGEEFVIYFDAWNPDPQREHNVTFTVVQKNTAWTDRTSFSFTSSNTARLPPNPTGTNPTKMGLQVTVPRDAGAGSFRFTVKGVVDTNENVYASFDFNITISVRRALDWSADLPEQPMPIRLSYVSAIFFNIENAGNVIETVNVSITTEQDFVKIWINDAPGGLLTNLRLEPGQTQQVKIGLEAREESRNKQEATIRVRMKSADNPSLDQETDVKLVVEKEANEVFFEFLGIMWLPTVLLALVAVLVYSTHRNRVRTKGDEEDEDEGKGEGKGKKPQHGTVVRQ